MSVAHCRDGNLITCLASLVQSKKGVMCTCFQWLFQYFKGQDRARAFSGKHWIPFHEIWCCVCKVLVIILLSMIQTARKHNLHLISASKELQNEICSIVLSITTIRSSLSEHNISWSTLYVSMYTLCCDDFIIFQCNRISWQVNAWCVHYNMAETLESWICRKVGCVYVGIYL